MARMGNPERALVYKAEDHACNQAIVVALKSGELIAIFNEERTLIHADNGYTSIIRSKDGGRSWDPSTRQIIVPPTETEGNWNPAISQLSDGTLMVDFCLTAFFKRGMDWDGPQYDAGMYSSRKAFLGTNTEVFAKTTRGTPCSVLDSCRRRLARYQRDSGETS